MAESAFVVYVPEAESCVGPLRERFDASARLGVPAHVTVLVPFMSPERITDAVTSEVRRALSAVRSFSFALSEVRRFPATAYLAPEPAEPFIALTESLVRSFPEYPPFRGEFETIVPHLTVANGNAAQAAVAAAELAVAMQARGHIASVCTGVALLENSTGMWRELRSFPLPRRHNDA